ncbi:hypothetical protein [Lactiplantibacillus plantarum]|uniref:hypothetical protein n=1 Tax=Lactiplantibacillus plantarum TaxID=1590 RepID=UPI0013019347|nr:hypothetical protein [Lactiplantibacillus plantarum]
MNNWFVRLHVRLDFIIEELSAIIFLDFFSSYLYLGTILHSDNDPLNSGKWMYKMLFLTLLVDAWNCEISFFTSAGVIKEACLPPLIFKACFKQWINFLVGIFI